MESLAQIQYASKDSMLLVNIKVAPSAVQAKSNICFVLDKSGSMGSVISGGGAESTNLTRLDIAKHSIKTVIDTLGEDDVCSLITYSNDSEILFSQVQMTRQAKDKAFTDIDQIVEGGCTNMWAGIENGLKTLQNSRENYYNQHMFVLTDGALPDIPPGGYISCMRNFKDRNGGFYPCFIHTFGFCYDLDSQLLVDISNEGNGMYAFIPDGSMVGTVFINALANAVTTVGQNVKLSIEVEDASIIKVEGDSSTIQTQSWGGYIDMNSLQDSSNFSFAFHFDKPVAEISLVEASLSFRSCLTGELSSIETVSSTQVAFSEDIYAVLKARELTVACIAKAITSDFAAIARVPVPAPAASQPGSRRNSNSSIASRFLAAIGSSPSIGHLDAPPSPGEDLTPSTLTGTPASSPVSEAVTIVEGLIQNTDRMSELKKDYLRGLIADLTGQVTEAVSNEEAYNKWGRHYLPSLRRAHVLHQCNNFKDPGIQFYASQLFETVRGLAEENFMRLPPPKPRERNRGYGYGGGGGGVARASATPIDMSAYVNRGGGCIHGDCSVTMWDGSRQLVSKLSKGDKLLNGSAIACVLRSPCTVEMEFVKIGGLVITPWHPIRDSQQGSSWEFPCHVKGATPWSCANPNTGNACESVHVYSFLMEDNGNVNLNVNALGIEVEGYACATLGHGVEGDAVLSHEFLGSDLVVQALKKSRGWVRGQVDVSYFVRDVTTDRVIGFVESTGN